jgi:hypothetical protein
MKKNSNHSQYLISKIPINELFSNMESERLPLLAQQHELFIPKMLTAKNKIKMKNIFMQHREPCCDKFVTIFETNGPKAKYQKLSTMRASVCTAPEHTQNHQKFWKLLNLNITFSHLIYQMHHCIKRLSMIFVKLLALLNFKKLDVLCVVHSP